MRALPIKIKKIRISTLGIHLITLGLLAFPSSASWPDMLEAFLKNRRGYSAHEAQYIVRGTTGNEGLTDITQHQARAQELAKVKTEGFATKDYIEERQQNNSPDAALKNLALYKKVAALIANHKAPYDEKTARELFKEALTEGGQLETAEELDTFHRIASDAKKKKAFFILKKMNQPATQESLLDAAVVVNEAGYGFESPGFPTFLPFAQVAFSLELKAPTALELQALKKVKDFFPEDAPCSLSKDLIQHLASLTPEDQERHLHRLKEPTTVETALAQPTQPSEILAAPRSLASSLRVRLRLTSTGDILNVAITQTSPRVKFRLNTLTGEVMAFDLLTPQE